MHNLPPYYMLAMLHVLPRRCPSCAQNSKLIIVVIITIIVVVVVVVVVHIIVIVVIVVVVVVVIRTTMITTHIYARNVTPSQSFSFKRKCLTASARDSL